MTLPVGDLDHSVEFYRAALVAGMGWAEREVEGAPTFGLPAPRTSAWSRAAR
jgi:hypothetical protein